MFQVCMFGAYEGRLRPNKRVFLTLFGGCELHRPTVARQLLAHRSQRNAPQSAANRRQIAITLFGATEITSPTLAEEFIDLQEAIRSGALTWQDWDDFLNDINNSTGDTVFSLTLFGGFCEAGLPEEDAEVDGLAIQRHLGNISDSALQTLQLGVGQSDAQRRAIVRKAIDQELQQTV